MKAILINAKEKTITEVQLEEKDSLQAMYDLLGVELIETVPFADLPNNPFLEFEDMLIVDEEGLINGTDYGFKIHYRDGLYPLMGNGLIIGCDKEGANANCISTVESIKEFVVEFI
jgi:hypothetical protein